MLTRLESADKSLAMFLRDALDDICAKLLPK